MVRKELTYILLVFWSPVIVSHFIAILVLVASLLVKSLFLPLAGGLGSLSIASSCFVVKLTMIVLLIQVARCLFG